MLEIIAGLRKCCQTVYERIKRVFSDKFIFFLLLGVFIISVIPIFIIAFYNTPSADDFSYSVLTHKAWDKTGSILEVLKGACEKVASSYNSWQGTFTSIFLFALQPAIFGYRWYFLTTFIMIAVLSFGIIYFCDVVFRRTIGADKYQTGIVVLLILLLCINMLPSPVQAFFWFNGSVHYTFFFGLSLVLYAKIIRYIQTSENVPKIKSVIRLVTIIILSVFISGSNYVTTLATAVIYVAFIVYICAKKHFHSLWLLVPFCLYSVGFAINIVAPGNTVRQTAYFDKPNAIKAIGLALIQTLRDSVNWLSFPLLCVLIFSVPILYAVAVKSKLSFRHPLAMIAASFLFLAVMFTPSLYAMGVLPGRISDVIFFAYVILLFANTFYILGYINKNIVLNYKNKKLIPRPKSSEKHYSSIFIIFVAFSFVISSATFYHIKNFTVLGATKALVDGSAYTFNKTFYDRCAVLEDDNVKDVVFDRLVDKLECRPYVLFLSDFWDNEYMSDYYDKNSITIRVNDEVK